MALHTFTVNAFVKEDVGGNPAGVVLAADQLTEKDMQFIAQKMGFSETAFVSNSDKADYNIRFFTPNGEVDLCGHATIATWFLLLDQKMIQPGTYTQEIKAGVLKVEVKPDGTILMDQTLPQFGEVVDLQHIEDIFDIPTHYVSSTNLSPQIVSTGLRDILLPIGRHKHLLDLKPDFDKMKQLNKATNTVGFHAFTLETLEPYAIAHCRNFAPLYDIPEESATGSSNGALACYLYKYGKLTPSQAQSTVIFEQGYSMGQPSEIRASLEVKGTEITRVKVGGKAAVTGEKEIEI